MKKINLIACPSHQKRNRVVAGFTIRVITNDFTQVFLGNTQFKQSFDIIFQENLFRSESIR